MLNKTETKNISFHIYVYLIPEQTLDENLVEIGIPQSHCHILMFFCWAPHDVCHLW